MVLQEFKNKYLGKQIEFHSYGAGAYNQCVDLINAYINMVLDNSTKDYTEIIGTDAKDFNTKYDPEDFEWIANTPSGIPHEGDIVVWNGRMGGGAGHTGIFLEGNVNSFQSLDQNWSKKEYVTLETHNYTNVSGWLRPKNLEPKADISQKELDQIREDRDDNHDETEELKKQILAITKDLRDSQEYAQGLLEQLEKVAEEDLSTSEQILEATKASEKYRGTLTTIKSILGLEAGVKLKEIEVAVSELKESKVITVKAKDSWMMMLVKWITRQ